MKKLATALLFLLMFTMVVSAQVNYTFGTATGVTFTPITGTGFTWTTTSANDEEYSSATNIFDGVETFTYGGVGYTQFQVSTNGFIRLGTGLAAATAADALSGLLRGVIAPLWDDLAVSATATDVTYEVTGTSGNYVLTVEWRNVKWNKTAGAANAEFQVKLYQATGDIEFIYGAMTAPTAGSASIGLADYTTISSTTNPSTGKFLSINVGGTSGSRVYHQSRSYLFSAINNAPDGSTKFTFTAVTPSAIGAGTYTVGGTTPTYATLSEAAQALNIHGISGAVVLDVRTGTYDDIFHLINVSGTSETNTITLKNESGAVTLVPKNGSGTSATGGSFSSDAIIRLDGAQYTKIEGLTLNDNGLATTMLKFAVGVMLGNSVNPDGSMGSGGRFNHLKNLTIDMKSTTGVNHTGSIGIRYFTTGSTEPDTAKTTSWNKIENCNITGFWRAGWKTFGISGTNPDRGNIMTGCTLGNFSIASGVGSDVRCLEMDVQNGIIIDNNIIENIDVSIMTTNSVYGIWFNPASSTSNMSSGTITIRNNTIRNLENSGVSTTSGFAVGFASNNVVTSTEYRVYNNKIYDLYSNGSTTSRAYGIGIFMSTGTGVTAKIYNNMISDLRAPRSTSSPGVRGMDLQNAAGTGTFNVYHNTVNIDDAVPPTVATHRSACLHWANMGTGSIDLQNNIFINTQSTTTGISPALYATANSNFIRLASTTDRNLYYVGTTGATKVISLDVTTATGFQNLSDHKTALGAPKDANSTSAAVTFTSSSDLHVAGGSIGDFTNLIGTLLSSPYDVDIDGNTRNNPPYIGADENTGSPLPVELTSFTAITKGNSVELQWNTASEVNNHGFEVERSAKSNGTWENLGFIQGAGNSNAPKSYSFVDASAQGAVQYRLKQIDNDGKFTYSNIVEVNVVATVVQNYELSQNYPNPFNPTTTIRFAVKNNEHATVKVFDITGREVATLFNETAQPGQMYNVQFNATGLSSGIYFYVLQTPSFRDVKKMSLLK